MTTTNIDDTSRSRPLKCDYETLLNRVGQRRDSKIREMSLKQFELRLHGKTEILKVPF